MNPEQLGDVAVEKRVKRGTTNLLNLMRVASVAALLLAWPLKNQPPRETGCIVFEAWSIPARAATLIPLALVEGVSWFLRPLSPPRSASWRPSTQVPIETAADPAEEPAASSAGE